MSAPDKFGPQGGESEIIVSPCRGEGDDPGLGLEVVVAVRIRS